MTTRRVLVSGAGGFVGRHVVEALAERGLLVRATDREGTLLPDLPSGIERDLRDLSTAPLDDLLEGVTDIVHVAGLFDLGASRDSLFAANVDLTRRIALAAVERDIRLVHISSVTVYGRPRKIPVREDAPHRPASAYEESKREGERVIASLVRDRGLRATILRPSGIYGPWGRYGLAVIASAYALSLASGRVDTIPAFRGGTKMTHVHVEDVASAVACVLEKDETIGKAYNVADDTEVAWGDLLEVIERTIGIPPRERVPMSKWRAKWTAHAWRLWPESKREKLNRSLDRKWRALVEERGLVPMLSPRLDRHAYDYWLADHVYSNDALKRLGFRLRHPDSRQGLAETIAWYLDRRWLPAPTK